MDLLERPLSRRRLLRLIFWTPVAWVLARFWPWGCAPSNSRPERLKILNASEARVLQTLANLSIPPGGTIPLGAQDFDIPHLCEKWLGIWPREIALFAKVLIRVIEWAPFLVIGKGARMTHLSPELQELYLERFSNHRWYPLRNMIRLPRALCFNAFYGASEVKEAMGYQLRCG